MRRALLLSAGLVLLVVSCENVFTTSPFSFLRRDPSTLSEAQKQRFAQDALASGDESVMAEAYEAIKDTTDPATQLLAADLAIGASGLEGAVTDTASLIAGGADPVDALDDALSGFTAEDLILFEEAAALINAADDSVTPTAEQYAFAAIGMIAVAADAAGGAASVEGSVDPDVTAAMAEAEALLQASYDTLQASGESTDLIVSLWDAVGTPP